MGYTLDALTNDGTRSDTFYANCIRDHKELNELHKKTYRVYCQTYYNGIEIVSMLDMCLLWITEPKSALDAARSLRVVFPEDETLMEFADWLEKTAEWCDYYELSR
jgi:hypothetical protein